MGTWSQQLPFVPQDTCSQTPCSSHSFLPGTKLGAYAPGRPSAARSPSGHASRPGTDATVAVTSPHTSAAPRSWAPPLRPFHPLIDSVSLCLSCTKWWTLGEQEWSSLSVPRLGQV